jgi:hypothetical protein
VNLAFLAGKFAWVLGASVAKVTTATKSMLNESIARSAAVTTVLREVSKSCSATIASIRFNNPRVTNGWVDLREMTVQWPGFSDFVCGVTRSPDSIDPGGLIATNKKAVGIDSKMSKNEAG